MARIGFAATAPFGADVLTRLATSHELGHQYFYGLVASNEFVSRAHAEIRPKNGRYFLRDLGSRNGTFVNGKKVSGEQELAVNDTITLGPDPVGQRYRFVRTEVGA